MFKVVHLLPQDGLGGAEAAARSLADSKPDSVQVWFMAGTSISNSPSIRELQPTRKVSSLLILACALRELLLYRPNVLVVSLWRASLVGIIYKILIPRVKLVPMIHSTRYAHVVDKFITSSAIRLATRVWFDSRASCRWLQGEVPPARQRVISFFIPVASSVPASRGVSDFVYWGRLSPVKNVPAAVEFFEKVWQAQPGARFFIYGPDDGDLYRVQERVAMSVCRDHIFLCGEKPPGAFPEALRGCSFFLMLSNAEGMAVSVVEAMQLGLVPVVSPRGEIPSYCRSGFNAVICTDTELAISEVLGLIVDRSKYNFLSGNAVQRWVNIPSYSDDFVLACDDLRNH